MSTQPPNPTKRERREAARAQRMERERAAEAAATRRKRLYQLGGLLAAAVAILVIAIAVSSGGGKKSSGGDASSIQGAADSRSLVAGIPQKGITLGKATAPVTIVEFADPQCPFCKNYTLQEMPSVIQKYVKTGKAKMELRYLTFIGPDSLAAARPLEAAGLQDKLWQASDLFYRNQGEENSGYVTDDFLTGILKGAGADAPKAMDQAGTSAVSEQLAEAKTLSSRYAVNGTPTILVGPTGGELKKDNETAPTAAGIGRLVDTALAAKGGT
jgi:protein-disulfide isomerase